MDVNSGNEEKQNAKDTVTLATEELLSLISICVSYNNDLRLEISSREIDRASLAHAAGLAYASVSEMEAQLAESEAKIIEIFSSKSWRWTKFLRAIDRAVKKFSESRLK
jgi:hypothetical protein